MQRGDCARAALIHFASQGPRVRDCQVIRYYTLGRCVSSLIIIWTPLDSLINIWAYFCLCFHAFSVTLLTCPLSIASWVNVTVHFWLEIWLRYCF